MPSRLGNSEFLSPIRTSFIGQYMESAYRDAAEDAGKSSKMFFIVKIPNILSDWIR